MHHVYDMVDVTLALKGNNRHFMEDIHHLLEQEDKAVLNLMLDSFAVHWCRSSRIAADKIYNAFLQAKQVNYRWIEEEKRFT